VHDVWVAAELTPEGAADLLVLSPHFDDAVLSATELIERNPGTTVVTVCGGRPPVGMEASPWDYGSGFASAFDAADARRREDFEALSLLGARQVCLEFFDGPYRIDESVETVADAIGSLIDCLKPQRCALPLGLSHADHKLVSNATLRSLRDRPQCLPIAYADLPYAITDPSTIEERLTEIGVSFVPYPSVAVTRKEAAVDCYRSQHNQLTIAHPRWRESITPGAESFFRLGLNDDAATII